MHSPSRIRGFALCLALLGSWIVAEGGCRSDAARTAADEPVETGHACFTAAGDGAEPSQTVFEELGRTGNGETWYAILERVLDHDARMGSNVDVEEMGFGWQREVEFQGRRSWIGIDVEGGGAIFCTPDRALLRHLESTYETARNDPATLRRLIGEVPADAWDD